MDKLTTISMLLDFYGCLLTDKQYEIMDLYYNNDYSLSEISENLGITRQGVHDSIKRTENSLLKYEEKLQLANKFLTQKQDLKEILNSIIELKESFNKKNTQESSNRINDIINKMEKLINYNE